MVGEWWNCISWSHTGEGDRAGWTIVGRTWEMEIRWWSVVHLDTHIQSCMGRLVKHSILLLKVAPHLQISINISVVVRGTPVTEESLIPIGSISAMQV